MGIKSLAKNTAFLAVTKMVAFIFGLIRAKINAIIIGPEGIGILNQLREILKVIHQMSLLSMQNGSTKLIAKYNSQSNYQEIAKVIKTFSCIILPLSIIIFFVGIIFSGKLTLWILGDKEYIHFFVIGFLAMPFLLIKSIPGTIYTGLKEIKFMALNDLLIAIFSFVCFLPLIFFLNLQGVIYLIPLTYIFTFVIYVFIARRKLLKKITLNVKDIIKADFDISIFKNILSFASMGLITAPIVLGSTIIIRTTLATTIGIEKIGIYNPILAWSGIFQGFLIPSLREYIFPRISEMNKDKDIEHIVNDSLRLMLFISIPFILLGIGFREIAIKTFYSNEFLQAAKILPYHFMGITFIIVEWALRVVFQPTGKLKAFTIFISLYYIFNTIIVIFLSSQIGLYAWMLTFTVTPFIFSLIYYLYLYYQINLVIYKSNLFFILYTISIGMVMTINIFDDKVNYIISIVSSISIIFFLKKVEKQVIIKRLRKFFNKF